MVKVTIITGNNEKIIDIESGKTLFSSLSDKNIDLPYGCLAGSCSACKIKIIEGDLSPQSSVESDTISAILTNLQQKYPEENLTKDNLRLSCRAKPLEGTNLKIKILE